MKTLTSSSLSTFRDCPRKYQYKYDLKRVPVSDRPCLSFGKVVHAALAEWWLHGMEAAIEALKTVADQIDPADAAKICAMLKNYNPPRTAYDVLAVEQPFEIKIQNPSDGGRAFYGYRLAGKLDMVVRHKATGVLWVVDHKTTSSDILGFGTFWQALQIDSQMINYCLAVPEMYGEPVAGFVYDVLKKLGIRLCGTDEKAAKARQLDPVDVFEARCNQAIEEQREGHYQWREFTKTDADTLEARRDLWQQVEMFRACDNDGRFPRNCNSCVGRYGTCEYLGVCAGTANIEDDAAFRTKADDHEELNGGVD